MPLFETIIGGLALAMTLGVAAVSRRDPLPISAAAPNPRDVAHRITPEFDGEFAETFTRSRDAAAMGPYVPPRARVMPPPQAATLDDMDADKDATRDELVATFAKFERLLGSLRMQSAACRARLEIEKAELAARAERLDREDAELAAFAGAELDRMRAALGLDDDDADDDADDVSDDDADDDADAGANDSEAIDQTRAPPRQT